MLGPRARAGIRETLGKHLRSTPYCQDHFFELQHDLLCQGSHEFLQGSRPPHGPALLTTRAANTKLVRPHGDLLYQR